MTRIKSYLQANSTIFEIAKNMAEILALAIGATWAIYNFELKDAPSLEKSPSLSSEISIDTFTEKKIHVNFAVHIKNIGKTSFEVSDVKVAYWLIPIKRILDSSYFPIQEFMREDPKIWITDTSLAVHYPPDMEYNQGFDFILDRNPDYAIVIRAYFSFKGNKGFFRTEDNWNDDTYESRMHCVPDKKP